MTIYIILAFLIGLVVGFAFYWCLTRYGYEEHGGQILIDAKNGVYRLSLNGTAEDWEDAKWVLLKVIKSEQRLRRLADAPDKEEDVSLDEDNRRAD